MLKFSLASDGGYGAGRVSLSNAYLFGSGGQPIAGASAQIVGSEIVCSGPLGTSAGLCLEYAAGDRMVVLQTCLLPTGQQTYSLALELARRRIMLLLTKVEEWGLFDDPAAREAVDAIDAARERLIASLSAANPAAREREASDALALAMSASETLVTYHARVKLRERHAGLVHAAAVAHAESISGGESAGPAPAVRSPDGIGVILPGVTAVGCMVNPARFSDSTAGAIAPACDFVTVPMHWSGLEPQEGVYSFANTDRWIEWAVRRAKIGVVAGPVIDLSPGSSPDWLSIWENDYETLRELVYEHIRQVVTRYRRTVSRWIIVSGLAVNDHFQLSYDKMADLTRICAMVVRKLHPHARVQVDLSHPWGEYTATNPGAIGPESYLQLLQQAVIDYDAIGLRIVQRAQGPERDPLAVAELLDAFAAFDRPIHISALSAPSAGSGGSGANALRGEWSPQRQAEWLESMIRVCAGTHYVQSICWGELIDGAGCLVDPAAGLFNSAGMPKPALERLVKWRRLIREGGQEAPR